MDRKREEIAEHLTKEGGSTLIVKTSNDDDAGIESCDTFDSWTLVNNKKDSKLPDNSVDEKENRIEVVKNCDKHDEDEKDEENETDQEPQTQNSSNDATNEDLSDGISVISESESQGSISPHVNLRDHLYDLNGKFSLSDPVDDMILKRMRRELETEAIHLLAADHTPQNRTEQQLRKKRRSSTGAIVTANQALQKASQTVQPDSSLLPLVKRGLQGIFYVGMALALLGLIGKIVNPPWQQLSSDKSNAQMEEAIIAITHENNLMRAEIDLLSKQVKYLTSISGAQQQKPAKLKDYKENKYLFEGRPLEPVDIRKHDLKKQYKCTDGNTCTDKKSTDAESSTTVEEQKKNAGVYAEFVEMAEHLLTPDILYNTDEQDNYPNLYNHMSSKTDKKYKSNEEYRKSYDKYENKENKKYKQFSDHKSSRVNSEERNDWHSDKKFDKKFDEKFNKNSKERKYHKDNSKERFTIDFNDSNENSKQHQSKERNGRQKRKNDNRNNSDNDSGEWQEKYMRNREQQRQQNDQRHQKNWYFKRGDSRENTRSGEKQYR